MHLTQGGRKFWLNIKDSDRSYWPELEINDLSLLIVYILSFFFRNRNLSTTNTLLHYINTLYAHLRKNNQNFFEATSFICKIV